MCIRAREWVYWRECVRERGEGDGETGGGNVNYL